MSSTHYRRTKLQYDLDKVLSEFKSISPRIQWLITGGSSQTCVQYSTRTSMSVSPNSWTDGAGSFKNTDKDEADYNQLNPVYKGTVFEQIINDLDGLRARVMTRSRHSCYSMHKDRTLRYHLAMNTNPYAYMYFPDDLNSSEFYSTAGEHEIVHIPADGYIYETDTRLWHSAINCGNDSRTHFVLASVTYKE